MAEPLCKVKETIGLSTESHHAAGTGPAATSFFLWGSTVRFKPSKVREPNKRRSPFSANTTSSTVKWFSTRTIAKPTLRVIIWPLAIKHVFLLPTYAQLVQGFFRNPSIFTSRVNQKLGQGRPVRPVRYIFDPAPHIKCARVFSLHSAIEDSVLVALMQNYLAPLRV